MKEEISLVTGAFGFTGKELLERGGKVIATDTENNLRNPELINLKKNLGLNLNHPQLTLIPADLLHKPSLENLFSQAPAGVYNIYHTASLYDYSADLATLRKVNVEGTVNFIDVIMKYNIKHFIHWSTCGVFGKPIKNGEYANIPFTEESPSPKNMPVTVIRPAPIYGPGSNYSHGGVIIAIAKGYLPIIPADAKNSITLSVHVRDLARFAVFIAQDEKYIGEDFNVVDNSIISYYDFLHYIALLTGKKIIDIPLVSLGLVREIFIFVAESWSWLEKNFHIPRLRILEVQSAPYIGSSYWVSNRKSQATGFVYSYPGVKEGLKDTVTWFKKFGWIK